MPRDRVEPPATTPARYGLFSAATVVTDAGNGARWELGGIEFESVQCVQGFVWAYGCGPPYSVILTKTAVANQYSVNYTPDAGPYEVSINGGAYAVVADLGTILTPNASNTVVVREATGLRRRVTLTNVLNNAANGTTVAGSSTNQAYNDPKSGTGKPTTTSDPFGVVAGVACGSLGTLDVDDETRARAALAVAEQRLVEATFERGTITPRLAAGDGVVVTPAGATAVRVKRAVAELEHYIGNAYGGTGVLHAPRRLGAYLPVERDGAVLRTRLGTPVAFGQGYDGVSPAGAAPGAGEAWIYATGAITIRRSAMQIPATGAETLDRATNQTLLIAERSYMVSADCLPVAAALVDLDGEDAL